MTEIEQITLKYSTYLHFSIISRFRIYSTDISFCLSGAYPVVCPVSRLQKQR
jgi:hypothetical protein